MLYFNRTMIKKKQTKLNFSIITVQQAKKSKI